MLTFDQLCRGLDVEISAFAVCEVRKGANFTLSEDEVAAVHYVLSGEGYAWQPLGKTAELKPHTVMIVAPGTSVTITNEANRRGDWPEPQCDSMPGSWNRLTVGDGSEGLFLACGYVHARYMDFAGLFDYLREPLVASVADDKTFRLSFDQLLEELADPKPGTKVLAEMLMKQCLIAFLRIQANASGVYSVPWLAALSDDGLGRALSAMQEAPEAKHTIESLGEIAGMSRGVFAKRFKEAFGYTVIESLREIRLRRAATLLATTELPVKTVAYRVGFDSRSYFSRSFKKFAGVDPAGYRANLD